MYKLLQILKTISNQQKYNNFFKKILKIQIIRFFIAKKEFYFNKEYCYEL